MYKLPTALAHAAATVFLCGHIAAAATVATPDNPYQSIIQRNLFGLLSPPPPAAPEIQTPPLSITLTGVTTVLGDRRALFKTPSTGVVGWKQHMLVEGQSEDEIKLLAIDVPMGTARFINHGVLQIVAICKTPSLAVGIFSGLGEAPSTVAANGVRFNNNFQSARQPVESPDGSPFVRGGAGRGGAATGAAANAGTPGSSSPGSGASISTPGWGAATVDTFALDGTEPWWLAGSKLTEQARLRSAADVQAGLADPQPLTPLTPPGTPADLVGPDQAYFIHWSPTGE